MRKDSEEEKEQDHDADTAPAEEFSGGMCGE